MMHGHVENLSVDERIASNAWALVPATHTLQPEQLTADDAPVLHMAEHGAPSLSPPVQENAPFGAGEPASAPEVDDPPAGGGAPSPETPDALGVAVHLAFDAPAHLTFDEPASEPGSPQDGGVTALGEPGPVPRDHLDETA